MRERRGQTMYLRSAARGFLAFLLLVSALHGYHGWTVTYTSSKVCALRGSTVEVSCSYEYPDKLQNRSTLVETLWFTKEDHSQPGGLVSDTDYAGRVVHSCEQHSCSLSSCSGNCTLRIRDLRQSDSAEYKVRFITNQPGGEYTGDPGVKLTVTDLKVERKPYLECQSMCVLSDHPNYVWYKNGQLAGKGMTYSNNIKKRDSFSCAVEGSERFHSPLVSSTIVGVKGNPNLCNKVTYSTRTMCVLQGTSVDISCTYSRGLQLNEEYWYAWSNNNEDLQKDSEYKGRVEYPVKEKGRSTLKITDLRDTDSAEYRFKYKSRSHEWKSALHGTTLTVTGLRVEGAAVAPVTEGQRVTLSCSARCLLPGQTSYIWYHNKGPVAEPESTMNKLVLDPVSLQHAGNYSCSVRGYPHQSPEETLTVSYAPKTTSVTVSPSGEEEEGSSVTLSCSSEAKPEANSPVEEPGQNLTTAVITSELGEIATPSLLTAVALGTTAVLLTIIALLVVLWMRRKMASGKASGPAGRPDTTEALPVYENASALTNRPAPAAQREPIERQEELHYGDIQHPHHSEMQEAPRCLAGSLLQSDQTHQVVYSGLNFKGPDAVLELTVLPVTAPSGLNQ
ncbi:unnamed protein product [Arctogadus glacialis]